MGDPSGMDDRRTEILRGVVLSRGMVFDCEWQWNQSVPAGQFPLGHWFTGGCPAFQGSADSVAWNHVERSR